MRKLIFCFLAVFALVGCVEEEEPISEAEAQLKAAITKWNASTLKSYQYTFQRVCFCIDEPPVVITVEDNQIVSAVHKDIDQPVSDETLAQLMTITEMFELIEKEMEKEVEVLNVTYHPDLGYPLSVFVDVWVNVADEEYFLYVSEFH